MDRRDYLRAIGAAAATGIAGCAAPSSRSSGTTASPTRTGTGEGAGLPVARDELERGASKNAIPAITDPVFGEDWSGISMEVYKPEFSTDVVITPRLTPEDLVLGVARGDRARAYPLRVLNWHEIVNDRFGGPLLVTYCPLCRTGVTAVRTVNDEQTVFGVSGLLYRSNLVMFDRATGSLWSQVQARAIRGPETGTRLDLLPSTLTSLKEWRAAHPETTVLLPPPESGTIRGHDAVRDYTTNPYAGYEASDAVGVTDREYDRRLHPKTLVVGIAHGGAATAYPLPAVREAGGLVNDGVGGLPVVVVATSDDTLAAYVRRVDGERRTFRRTDAGTLAAAGTRWDAATGRAVAGRFEGTELDRANDRSPMFWFSWADLRPDTTIYGGATRTTRKTGAD